MAWRERERVQCRCARACCTVMESWGRLPMCARDSPLTLPGGHPCRPLAQGYPPRRPHQLDLQPRPQAPRGSWPYLGGQEEPWSRQGLQVQPHPPGRHLAQAQHPLAPPLPVNVSLASPRRPWPTASCRRLYAITTMGGLSGTVLLSVLVLGDALITSGDVWEAVLCGDFGRRAWQRSGTRCSRTRRARALRY